LQEEFTPEEIEDYACEACKKKVTVTKQAAIWKLPKVLILTIKRFDWQGRKVTTPISYDLSALHCKDLFPKESYEDSKNKYYKLFATVDHHGGSLGGGHYTAQTFNSVWKKWYLYDDETAHEIQEPRVGSHSYILFFRQGVKDHADAA
jgi:ubiquitin C-terminal hydrolase